MPLKYYIYLPVPTEILSVATENQLASFEQGPVLISIY